MNGNRIIEWALVASCLVAANVRASENSKKSMLVLDASAAHAADDSGSSLSELVERFELQEATIAKLEGEKGFGSLDRKCKVLENGLAAMRAKVESNSALLQTLRTAQEARVRADEYRDDKIAEHDFLIKNMLIGLTEVRSWHKRGISSDLKDPDAPEAAPCGGSEGASAHAEDDPGLSLSQLNKRFRSLVGVVEEKIRAQNRILADINQRKVCENAKLLARFSRLEKNVKMLFHHKLSSHSRRVLSNGDMFHYVSYEEEEGEEEEEEEEGEEEDSGTFHDDGKTRAELARFLGPDDGGNKPS